MAAVRRGPSFSYRQGRRADGCARHPGNPRRPQGRASQGRRRPEGPQPAQVDLAILSDSSPSPLRLAPILAAIPQPSSTYLLPARQLSAPKYTWFSSILPTATTSKSCKKYRRCSAYPVKPCSTGAARCPAQATRSRSSPFPGGRSRLRLRSPACSRDGRSGPTRAHAPHRSGLHSADWLRIQLLTLSHSSCALPPRARARYAPSERALL